MGRKLRRDGGEGDGGRKGGFGGERDFLQIAVQPSSAGVQQLKVIMINSILRVAIGIPRERPAGPLTSTC